MVLPHYVAAAAWLVGWGLFWRVPQLPPPLPPPLPPKREGETSRAPGSSEPVTIVIPCRDEAETLPLLLSDLEAVRPTPSRVIVVDDDSKDATGALASEFDFVTVIPSPVLESGSVGKSQACQLGANEAKSGTLVFLDADVRLHGDVVRRAVAEQRRRGGLLSIWPYHRVERPYEHLSALANVATIVAVGSASLVPPRRSRGAFGPFMVTSVEDYGAVGGHHAVRRSVVDDLALGRRYEDAGLPVKNYGGGRDASFRMYPNGVRSLWQGWTKNFGTGAFALSPWRVIPLIFWLVCSVGLLTWGHGFSSDAGPWLYGLFALQMAVMFRQVGNFGLLDAVLYPLHVLFLGAVLLRSVYRTYVSKHVTWRGREVVAGMGEGDVPS